MTALQLLPLFALLMVNPLNPATAKYDYAFARVARESWIVLYDSATGAERQLVRGFFPSLSPDGGSVVFCRAPQEGKSQLIRLDVATLKETVVLSPGVHLREPRWSPSGEWISFLRYANKAWQVRIVAPDGARERTVFAAGKQPPAGAEWLPDSRTLVVNDAGTIVECDLDGKILSRTPFGKSLESFVPSPQDPSLALYTTADALFLYQRGKKSSRRLRDAATAPAWSRNPNVVCFTVLEQGRTQARSLGLMEEDEVTFRAGDVQVAASLKNSEGMWHESEITIRRGAQVFKASTVITGGSRTQALAAIRKGVGWKEQFLFVRVECGGGNAWRCNRELVFTSSNGTLTWVGEIRGGDKNDKPGRYYENGYFIDIYDKLEQNPVTSHAGAPGLDLYMRYADHRLRIDLDETWKRNSSTAALPDDKLELKEELLRRAVLAKYCRKEKDLQSTLALVRSRLGAKMANQFSDVLADVVPEEW